MLLSNKSYDIAKRFVQVILPAIAALYFGLANIWGLPSAEQVVGSLAVITTFLGVILGLSTNRYNRSSESTDGIFTVHDEEGVKTYSLELNKEPEELHGQNQLTFKFQDDI